jgi:hypothetical protein
MPRVSAETSGEYSLIRRSIGLTVKQEHIPDTEHELDQVGGKWQAGYADGRVAAIAQGSGSLERMHIRTH